VIILDEQLANRKMMDAVRAWYRGAVLSVKDLRSDTVIKDEAIPALLSQKRQPTFVTINVSDFWQKVAISRKFCVVCFNVGETVDRLPLLLKLLFRNPRFSAKRQRAGHVFRITVEEEVRFYRHDNWQIQTFRL